MEANKEVTINDIIQLQKELEMDIHDIDKVLENGKHVPETIELIQNAITIFAQSKGTQEEEKQIKFLQESLLEAISKNSAEIFKLSGREFEELIAQLLNSFGWKVALTQQTRDGGYDIIGTSREIGGKECSWLIECKRYLPPRKVPIRVVRELMGVQRIMNTDNIMITATTGFSIPSVNVSKSFWNIHLQGLREIIEWVNTYKRQDTNKLYLKNNQLILISE